MENTEVFKEGYSKAFIPDMMKDADRIGFGGEVSQNIAQSIEHALRKCYANSANEAKREMDRLLSEVHKEVVELRTKVPVLHIQINDLEKRELSTRKSACLDMLLLNAKLKIYTLLVGPAGCGKTTMAQQVAEALGLQFGSLCLTAGASETWLFGRQTPNGFVEGSFSKLYKEGGVFLADEMDAADANLLLSINTALSHGVMFNPISGETIPKNENFIFIGAANTNGKGATHTYTGRSRLDAATLDRFSAIYVDYDLELELEILREDNNFARVLHTIRQDFKSNGYEEFISTRFFDKAAKMLAANVDPNEVLNILIANFGVNQKKRAREIYERNYENGPLKDTIRKKRAKKQFFSSGGIQWK